MRIPHTIPQNTLKAYCPSEQTLELAGEENRRIKAEDFSWDERMPPSLSRLCVQSLVDNFQEHCNVLPLLEPFHVDLIYEILPTSLPIEIVLPLIPEGEYWRRRCLDTWANKIDVSDYNDSWKCMFAECYLEGIIEKEEPYFEEWQDSMKIVNLCSPYVRRLIITQLQPPRVMESAPEPPDLCSVVEFIPEHIDLSPFILNLEHLQELCLQFGVRDCATKFTFSYFKVHVKDIARLALGLGKSKNLQKLQITCSDIDDQKLSMILKSLLRCESLRSLDFSHCKIGDIGAKALGYFLMENKSLKTLVLQNNSIGPEGALGLAFAIEHCDSSSLDYLNLKFNLIGDAGGSALASAISSSSSKVLTKLILSGSGLGAEAAISLADMLEVNKTLEELNLSNNALTNEGGEAIDKALQYNYTLQQLDVRNCEINEELTKKISAKLRSNRNDLRKKELQLLFMSVREKSNTSESIK